MSLHPGHLEQLAAPLGASSAHHHLDDLDREMLAEAGYNDNHHQQYVQESESYDEAELDKHLAWVPKSDGASPARRGVRLPVSSHKST